MVGPNATAGNNGFQAHRNKESLKDRAKMKLQREDKGTMNSRRKAGRFPSRKNDGAIMTVSDRTD